MTTIMIYQSNKGEYQRLTCKGHAGYADYGKDIVCASISCLVINTINSLDELVHEKLEITTEEEQGYIDCRFESLSIHVGRLFCICNPESDHLTAG